MQNGKGSKQRPTNLKKFNKNYDQINWKSKSPALVVKMDEKTRIEYHESSPGEHDVVVEAIEKASLHQND